MDKNKKKKIIEKVSHRDIYLNEFEGKIDTVIKFLQSQKNKIVKRKCYSNLRLVMLDDDSDFSPYFIVEADRLETDDEYDKRIKVQKEVKKRTEKNRKKRQEEEIKLYKQLRDKYGDI